MISCGGVGGGLRVRCFYSIVSGTKSLRAVNIIRGKATSRGRELMEPPPQVVGGGGRRGD